MIDPSFRCLFDYITLLLFYHLQFLCFPVPKKKLYIIVSRFEEVSSPTAASFRLIEAYQKMLLVLLMAEILYHHGMYETL